MNISAIDHIALEVGDVERSVEFYRNLGLQPERLDAFQRAEVPFPSMRAGRDSLIDLFPRGEPCTVKDARSLNHFALVAAEPLAQIQARLAVASIEIEETSACNFGARGLANSVYVRDPDGNRVEIRTYAAAAPGDAAVQ